jgi:hypothetical protein
MFSFPQTMRAVLLRDGKGDASALNLGDAPRTAPISVQVLVQIRAFVLNRIDIIKLNSMYLSACSPCRVEQGRCADGAHCQRRERDPRRRARGDRHARRATAGGGRRRRGANGSARGDRAMEGGRRGLRARIWRACLPSPLLDVADRLSCPQGAYAEYIVSPATHLIPKPASLSFVDAASIPEVWLTGACRLSSRVLRCLTHVCSVPGADCSVQCTTSCSAVTVVGAARSLMFMCSTRGLLPANPLIEHPAAMYTMTVRRGPGLLQHSGCSLHDPVSCVGGTAGAYEAWVPSDQPRS